jgi:hypothetical protein
VTPTSPATIALRAIIDADAASLADVRDTHAGILSAVADELDQPASVNTWRDRALIAGELLSITMSILGLLHRGEITADQAAEYGAKIRHRIAHEAAVELGAAIDQQLQRDAHERRQ